MAKALGEETLGVDERKIPSTASVRRVEEKVEELGLIFEEREEELRKRESATIEIRTIGRMF